MIVWRKRAQIALGEMLDWLWGVGYHSAADVLLQNIDKTLTKLLKNPTIGRPSKRFKTIRSYKIDEHRRIFYSMKGKKLFVIQIFDSRQNPDRSMFKNLFFIF